MEIEQVTAFSNEATMQQDIGTNVAAAMPTAAATPQITTSVASTAQPGSTIRRVTLSPDPETASPAPKRARTKRVPLGPLEFPTDDEKKKALAEFQNPADRALQKLLWAINCRYTLLPHQPEAVRAIAGLPASFPHHSAMDNSTDKMSVAETFRAFPIESKTKGILCADEMGLGKTVQSVVAMILRNKWYKEHGKRPIPSLIVSPNDAVMVQWKETLIKAGVSSSSIRQYKPKSSVRLEGHFFLLMTRYNIQTEARSLFNKVDMRKKDHPSSPLFPVAPKYLLHKLKNQYQADRGKAKNEFKHKGESEAACVARLLETFLEQQQFQGRPIPLSFRTVIADEAHFLKNLCSFWGIGLSLIGINAERIVPLTGTPYCNGNQDLASLMAFIDPTHGASRKDWWDSKTSKRAGPAVVAALGDWREDYMLLRKKDIVLKGKLPDKVRTIMNVLPYMIELAYYEQEEEKFLNVLESFRETLTDSPQAKQRLLELFSYAMAFLANMRKVLIHSMLSVGREISIRFSPSRAHLLNRQEKPKECVCCKAFKQTKSDDKDENGSAGKEDLKPPAPSRRRRRANAEWNMDLDDDQLQDNDEAEEVLGDEDDEEALKGPIVALPCDLCDWSEGPCRHFAHEKCVEAMREEGKTCPRCLQLNSIVHLQQTLISLDGSGGGMQVDQIGVGHRTYCANVSVSPGLRGGFKASAKIERVLEWIQSVPNDEKIIIYSFFKGALDLMEGVLTYDYETSCARFDGDVDKATRQADLDRFKTDPSCRVLLMTVQSGGTGLNIVEANNVCFMDRWFNPTVHAQAEDRCHRIGQQRQVNVFFADTAATVDEVMMLVNLIKARNASIILADGTEFSTNQDGSLNFKELAGLFGNLVRFVKNTRQLRAKDHFNAPLAVIGQSALEEAVENANKLMAQKKRAPVKSEPSTRQQPVEASPSTAASMAAPVSSQPSEPSGLAGMQEEAVVEEPQHHYETIGRTNVLNLSDDSDDDDELFADMKPTFKPH